MTPAERLHRIDQELAALQVISPQEMAATFTLPQLATIAPPAKKYRLLADGDSWFDYPLGQDVLDYLNNYFKHPVTKLARAGSCGHWVASDKLSAMSQNGGSRTRLM
jgi:hypothetical protein